MRIYRGLLHRVVVFGEDVGFGGVFRCTMGLQEKYGSVGALLLRRAHVISDIHAA